MFEITSGKVVRAQKVVVYGPEGIGKSSFAAQFPKPLFIDTEGSTSELDVKRLPNPSSYEMMLQEIDYVMNNANICKTLVIDTIDWGEQLLLESVLAKHQKKGIEDFGYGNGYVYVKEEMGRFLNKLTDVIEKGINVVLTAHAQIRKFEQPDELGAYDRYELKLGKKTQSQTAPLVKEWADMILFANYKTLSVAVDKDGKKHKAQGGSRIMYTSHHPCWDAKNRHGLPDELAFEYSTIAHIFNRNINTKQKEKIKEETLDISAGVGEEKIYTLEESPQKSEITYEGVPLKLVDLMKQENVTPEEIQYVVAIKGYYPGSTPIANYDPAFIDGVLIGAWSSVLAMIKEERSRTF